MTPSTPLDGHLRAFFRRKARQLARYGWQGWAVFARRAAPWALLAFALVQLKTLSDKVQEVENREFQAVREEVTGLRKTLGRLKSAVQAVESDVADTHASLKVVNDSLERARHRVPELSRAIEDAQSTSAALKSALPSSDRASALAQAMGKAEGQLTDFASGLPSADLSARLAVSIQTATRKVGDVGAELPEVGGATAFRVALEDQQKRVEDLKAALPAVETVTALAKALEADAAAVNGLRSGIPPAEQLDALRRDLQKAREALQAASLTPQSVPSSPALSTLGATATAPRP